MANKPPDPQGRPRSIWVAGLVAVVVVAALAFAIMMSDGTEGEIVGIEPAPSQDDLSEGIADTNGEIAPPEIELSGENVRPEDTDDFVEQTPAVEVTE